MDFRSAANDLVPRPDITRDTCSSAIPKAAAILCLHWAAQSGTGVWGGPRGGLVSRSVKLDDESESRHGAEMGASPEHPRGRREGGMLASHWGPRAAFSPPGPRRRTALAVCVGQPPGQVDGMSVQRSGRPREPLDAEPLFQGQGRGPCAEGEPVGTTHSNGHPKAMWGRPSTGQHPWGSHPVPGVKGSSPERRGGPAAIMQTAWMADTLALQCGHSPSAAVVRLVRQPCS